MTGPEYFSLEASMAGFLRHVSGFLWRMVGFLVYCYIFRHAYNTNIWTGEMSFVKISQS